MNWREQITVNVFVSPKTSSLRFCLGKAFGPRVPHMTADPEHGEPPENAEHRFVGVLALVRKQVFFEHVAHESWITTLEVSRNGVSQ